MALADGGVAIRSVKGVWTIKKRKLKREIILLVNITFSVSILYIRDRVRLFSLVFCLALLEHNEESIL